VNAPMIAVADYSKGSEGYTYNYYVSLLALIGTFLLSLFVSLLVCYMLLNAISMQQKCSRHKNAHDMTNNVYC
jgi:hypothetical protein